MGSLAGSVVLVTGGSGVVGGGVAKRALALGARVVAPVRSAAAKAKLLEAVSGAPVELLDAPLLADYATPSGAAALRKHLSDAKLTVDHAVVVGGGYAPPGFASQITAEALAEATATKLGSQVYLAQNLLPLVAPTGTYNVVTGLLGEAPEWAPYQALTGIFNAAVFTLVRSIQAERKDEPGPRVNELRLGAMIPAQAPTEEFAALVALVFADAAGGGKGGKLYRITPKELEAGALPA